MDHRNNSNVKADEFFEIHPSTPQATNHEGLDSGRDFVDVYVTLVQPHDCKALLQQVMAHFQHRTGIDLSHLRRVKRTVHNEFYKDHHEQTVSGADSPTENGKNHDCRKSCHSRSRQDDISHPPITPSACVNGENSKRFKSNETEQGKSDVELYILLGAVVDMNQDMLALLQKCDGNLNAETAPTVIQRLFHLKNPVEIRSVPGRMAQSTNEWKEFNTIWPTLFHPNKTRDHQLATKQLSQTEVEQMKMGMEAAIKDALEAPPYFVMGRTPPRRCGTIILDPQTGSIVGRASKELGLQQITSGADPTSNYNPLATSILYALQNVSRRERDRAIQMGMQSHSFQEGQYLCSGLDVYSTHEPTVFEAMAAVHSRIRRMVIGIEEQATTTSSSSCCSSSSHSENEISSRKNYNSGLVQMRVHALPGTNHKFRAFICDPGGTLASRCAGLRSYSQHL